MKEIVAVNGVVSSSSTVKTISTGDTCTVDVIFTPTRPGARKGAVTLSAAGATIATGYVYGTGTGPQVTFAPGTLSTINNSFNYAWGVQTARRPTLSRRWAMAATT